MKLTVLGKYGPFPKPNSATSGYLLEGEKTKAVLDLGSGTLSRLLDKISVTDLDFIVLSHLHYDHACDILPLSYALSFNKKQKVNLYLPKCDLPLLNLLKQINEYNVIFIEEGVTYLEGEFTFCFYKTEHPVISYGIKITNGEKTLAYTGDSTFTENLKNLVYGANFIVADGAFLERDHTEKSPHMSVRQAVSLGDYSKDSKVMVSHIGYKYSDEEVTKEIKSYSSTAFIAVEGEEYYI